MDILHTTLLIAGGAALAGVIGALTGLGGGVIIVPLLTLVLGVDIQYAIGSALVSVIATSSGAASAYVREGYSNIRVGMFLEVATTLGALGGAWLAGRVSTAAISVIFGVALLLSAALSLRPHPASATSAAPDRLATWLRMNGSYPVPGGVATYCPRRVPVGFGLMAVAGLLSGLLGIGSGALKVLAMDRVMGLPFKVSTTTSNFMIGVTAAASAGIYLHRGYIDPGLSMPVVLGVLAGSLVGTRLLVAAQVKVLRLLLAVVILALAIQMIVHGLSGAP
ncbi:MAG: sulfite exporter TauE/SafE family protein [Candidatus Rokubacteria bacterium]|nr:sulfite exporter TauE/SafE family protein [Candidatus Rokubacteria bacterium]